MKQILVVDDAPIVRLLVQKALGRLEKHGVSLLFAEDGHEALALIEKHRPGLVILDIMMAGKSGFDVCDTVKRRWKMDDVHVLLLTAKGLPMDRLRAEEVGADGFMLKPFEPELLLAAVRKALDLPPEENPEEEAD